MTVTEIARLANVSIATVDRVLHNRGRVAQSTKQKIEQIIEESGYQPDPLARHLKTRRKYQIGVVLPKLSTAYGYWEGLYNGIKNTAEQEFAAFSFTVQQYPFIRGEKASLESALTELISSESDAYILAPVMQNEIKSFWANHKIEKPYCFIDSPLPGISAISTIAQNPFNAGFMAGRLTELLAKNSGTFVVVKPFEGAFNLDERACGFCEWFKKNPSAKAKKIVSVAAKITPETSEKEIRKIVEKFPDMVAIFSVSVETFLIAREIKKLGLKEKVTVTGYDLIENNKIELQNNNIDALIDQNPYEQGTLSVRQIFKKLVYEENVEKEIHIPIEIYLKENLI